MEWLDRLAADILAPLAVWVLASGLDDLFLDLAFLALWLRSRLRHGRPPAATAEAAVIGTLATETTAAHETPPGAGKRAPQPGIAILVPCWQEAGVIEDMLDANLTAIEYDNYDVWLGVYPNDPATIERVVAAEWRFPRIRHVVCGNDGPTTKADCLNSIYAGICAHEAASGRRYAVLLQHDAEDLIHPRSLDELCRACARFDMVQIPVFPLPTPLHKFTHGIYCDEFAEYHLKELFVRARLGGFVPSAGVGTAYRREALEKLSEANGGQPFATESLTEDYVTGLELRRLDCSQTLLQAWRPVRDTAARGSFGARAAKASRRQIRRGSHELVATRAYFPFGLRAAIRQRSRWLTGNALQAWGRFGWRAGRGQLYWLWRDRKALLGSPASALANLLFFYGLARWVSLRGSISWDLDHWLGEHLPLAAILAANLLFVVWRQVVRGLCSFHIYGLPHACTAPLRAPWGNFVNLCAMLRALLMFARARVLGQPLAWAKTTHAYPGRDSLVGDRRLLGRILVSMEAVSQGDVEAALMRRRPGERLGECLLRAGRVSEQRLYEALALQAGLPFERLSPGRADPQAWQLLRPGTWSSEAVPYAVRDGTLWVAVRDAPAQALPKDLARSCRLPLCLVMVAPSNFAELRELWQRQTLSVPHRRNRRLLPKHPGRIVPAFPRMELKVRLPVWMAIFWRLSVTLEYRRVR